MDAVIFISNGTGRDLKMGTVRSGRNTIKKEALSIAKRMIDKYFRKQKNIKIKYYKEGELVEEESYKIQ